MDGQFSNIYPGLEPGRFFDTIWVALPSASFDYLKKLLAPIVPYCEWCALLSQERERIPHITLRYLGYDSPSLREQIIADKENFRAAIRMFSSPKINLGQLKIWESSPGGPEKTVRIVWEILNEKSDLKEIHKKLLTLRGYAFFQNLEGENFHPHINLAKVDLINPANFLAVKSYLQQTEASQKIYQLSDFQLNLASSDPKNSVRVNL